MTITPKIKDKYGTFDMGDVVAVITTKQWEELHRLALGNPKLQAFMLGLLDNDDLFKRKDNGE